MNQAATNRVHLLDEVRGLSILLMVVYHTFYDLVIIFGVRISAFFSPLVQGLVVLFAGIFIFISGSVSHYSHSNIKRGILCFGCGMLLTLGTALIMPDELILFGILHLLGVCMLLFPLAVRLIRKIPPLPGLAGCLLLFLLLRELPFGIIGIEGLLTLQLPSVLYSTPFLFWLGFPNTGFFSADYFPLIPWGFLFLAGGFFGVLLKSNRLPGWVYRSHIPPLAFIGRHTFLIYLLHQPVVYGVLWLVFQLIG